MGIEEGDEDKSPGDGDEGVKRRRLDGPSSAVKDIKREDYPSKNAYKKALKDQRRLKQKLHNKEQAKKERKERKERRAEEIRLARETLSEDELKASGSCLWP